MVFVKKVLNVMCLCCFGIINVFVIGIKIVLNFVCIVFLSCRWWVFFFSCICLLLGKLIVMVLLLVLEWFV